MNELPLPLGPEVVDDPRLLWGAGAAAALVLSFVLVLILRRLRRRPPTPLAPPVQPDLDVSRLPVAPVSQDGVRLEFYGTPVRTAVIVLAPVGREGIAPDGDEFSTLINQLVPGMAGLVARDQPVVRIWEPQVSSQGFVHAFSNRLPLPGERGKGTPWCSVAGKFTAFGRQYLVGIVCCAAGENALSQYVIQHEGQWNDVLRVRR